MAKQVRKGPVSGPELDRQLHLPFAETDLTRPVTGVREDGTVGEHVAAGRRRRTLATVTMVGNRPGNAAFALSQAANQLLCDGIVPEQFSYSLILPLSAQESDYRPWQRSLLNTVRSRSGKVVLSSAELRREDVKEPILTVTVTGSGNLRPKEGTMDKGYLIQCGAMGIFETIRMYETREELKRLPEHFRKGVSKYEAQLDLEDAIRTGYANGAVYMSTYDTGGIFTGLWNLGTELKLGMELDLPAMVISQQTIEACEIMDVNPYLLSGGGSVLMITGEPERLLAALWEKGYDAERIGVLTTDSARIVRNQEEVRNLEPYRGGLVELPEA